MYERHDSTEYVGFNTLVLVLWVKGSWVVIKECSLFLINFHNNEL